jgi:hypothetical protein
VSIAILVTPLAGALGTALAVMTEPAAPASPTRARTASPRSCTPSSAGNNNGSAFAGLSANTPVLQRGCWPSPMWFGRFGVIVPVLAMAGSLAARSASRPPPGTLPTHGPLFVVLLIGTVLLVGAAELRAGAGAGAGRRAPFMLWSPLSTGTNHDPQNIDPVRPGAGAPASPRLQASSTRACSGATR